MVYLQGSNKYKYSKFLRCIHTGVTYAKYQAPDHIYDYENHNHRNVFMNLPISFRGHLILGSFINYGSNLYKSLKKNHKVALGKKGSAYLFDGYITLHYGARPIKGKRLSLFQGFTPYYKLFYIIRYNKIITTFLPKPEI